MLEIAATIIVLCLCFAVVRRIKTKPHNPAHNTYWTVNSNQQMAHRVHKGYAKARPEAGFTIPLSVTEAPDEFANTTKRRKTTRYFERE